jgi:hypothetical protein
MEKEGKNVKRKKGKGKKKSGGKKTLDQTGDYDEAAPIAEK